MGLSNITVESLGKILPEKLEGLSIINLGDQRFFLQEPFVSKGREIEFLKEYFIDEGASVKEIDYHGLNGVLKLDFREDVPQDLVNSADLVTNFGFTEHVTNQYMAWKNVHNLLKVGGICISELPGEANFPGHIDCPYYTEEFFKELCEIMRYELIELRYQEHQIPIKGKVCWSVFKKVYSSIFISQSEFNQIESKLGRNI